jgi:cytochrome P450
MATDATATEKGAEQEIDLRSRPAVDLTGDTTGDASFDSTFDWAFDVPCFHEELARLRRDHPVARVPFHGGSAYLLTRHEHVEGAFRDEATFPAEAAYRLHSEPVMGRTLQCMTGAEHTRNRALVSPAFRARLMPGYVAPILAPVAHQLVDRIAANGEADLVAEFTKQFPFTVITRLLGIPERNEGDIQKWALALLSFPWDPDGALAASRDFTSYLGPIVAQRRDDPGDDLISTLATTEVDGEGLTDDEIFSFIRVLFPAGADTTYLGLGTLMYALMTHPDAMDRVRREPEARHAAIEEALRWEPPVSLMPRFAPIDTDEFGTPIRGGNQILFGVAAANRDPAQFPEPDRYDIDRDPSMSLTFGIGMHFCVGAHLARAELATALDVFLERFDDLTLVEDAATRFVGSVLRGPDSLPVRFTLS